RVQPPPPRLRRSAEASSEGGKNPRYLRPPRFSFGEAVIGVSPVARSTRRNRLPTISCAEHCIRLPERHRLLTFFVSASSIRPWAARRFWCPRAVISREPTNRR